MATFIEIFPVQCLDFAFRPMPWEFAHTRRTEIDAHFSAARRAKPALFNGQVLLLRDLVLDDRCLSGTFFPVDFASLLAWQEFGFPDRDVINVFAMGALRAADDAMLLGVMGAHTANAGQIYFPAGTPDMTDVTGNRVDLDASVWREVAEETGLTSNDIVADPGWTAVRHGPGLALMKSMRAYIDADALAQRIRTHLTAEPNPELADIRIVRGPSDLDPAMPDFTAAYLRHVWS